jgi:hypothetical protein
MSHGGRRQRRPRSRTHRRQLDHQLHRRLRSSVNDSSFVGDLSRSVGRSEKHPLDPNQRLADEAGLGEVTHHDLDIAEKNFGDL